MPRIRKKLFQLFEAWKASCEWEMHGQEALLSASLAKIIPLLWKEIEQNITKIGGMACWEALPLNDRESHEELISDSASNWVKINLMHFLQSNSGMLPCLSGENFECTRK